MQKRRSVIGFLILLTGMIFLFSAGTFAATKKTTKSAKAISKVVATGTDKAVKLKWSTVKNAKGYVILKTNAKGVKTGKRIVVTGGTKNSYTVTGLKNGKTYYFKMAAYFKKGVKEVGPVTEPVSVQPYNDELKQPEIKKIYEMDKAVKLTWKAVKGATTYAVKFKRKGQKTKMLTTGQKKCSIKITNLKNEKDYYVYIKALGTKNGKAMRSKWLKVHVIPNSEESRKKLLSQVNLTSAYAGGWDNYKVYPNNVAEAYANYGNNGGAFQSNTKYFLWLNLHCIRIYVFTKTNSSKWRLMDSWPCGIGAPGYGNTPSGTWTLAGHQYRDDHGSFYVLYCTFFTGYGTNAIHSESIPFMEAHMTAGKFESAGCVRVDLDHAKWVYDNCEGSTFLVR